MEKSHAVLTLPKEEKATCFALSGTQVMEAQDNSKDFFGEQWEDSFWSDVGQQQIFCNWE